MNALLRSFEPISRCVTSQTLRVLDGSAGSGARCGRAHLMTSLKICARVGCWGAKLATSPCSTARRSTRCAASSVSASNTAPAAVGLDDVDARLGAEPRGAAGGDELEAARGVLGSERVARPRRPDRARGDDDQVVAQPLHDIELMRGEQHRGAGCRALLQDAGDDVDREGVQARERLVEDEHLRVVHQRGGDLRALLIAERQRLDVVAQALAESESLEQSAGA